MALFGPAADLISSTALAEFGRYEFLGAEASGVSNAYSLVSALVSRSYPVGGPGYREVVAELRRHAQQGEWEKVGAWKYVRNFMSDGEDVADLIDGGLLAISRMRVTNLAIHIAPIDLPRYVELTGGRPPNDGFFGPPVFASNFGPSRQYYFDHAVAIATGRRIIRLVSVPGVPPGDVDDAAGAMWDFGMLICRGPLVVNPAISFEPNVVRPAVEAAHGVDHPLFADALAGAVLTEAPPGIMWRGIGAARFIEDYLHPAAMATAGYARLLDAGLLALLEMHVLGVAMTPAVLTARQRQRLSELAASQHIRP